jgi:hypothetical protein
LFFVTCIISSTKQASNELYQFSFIMKFNVVKKQGFIDGCILRIHGETSTRTL